MNSRHEHFEPGRSAAMWATLAVSTAMLAAVAQNLRAQTAPSSQEKPGTVSVELPASAALFPAGEGADIANSQCLMCHSAEMVVFQPTRTQDQWRETINKMRTAYGAPLPPELVDTLAAYLSRLKPAGEGS